MARFLSGFALLLLSLTASAEGIYRCTGANGALAFSDKPCPAPGKSDSGAKPGLTSAPGTHGQEELALGHLKVMERFLQILGGITDVAGAKQAQPELTALAAQNKDIFTKAKGQSLSNDAMVKYLQAHYKARGEAIFNGMFAAMSTMSRVPQFDEIGKYIGAPVNDLSNRTWTSISYEQHSSPAATSAAASPAVQVTSMPNSDCEAARFQLQVASAPDGVYQQDANGNFTRESDEQVQREKQAAEQKVRERCR